jgi:hypothetical protein
VRRYAPAFLILVPILIAAPERTLAHGFGERQDIPLPFWLYLFGMNAVVLATFVMIALSFDERRAADWYPRRNLLQNRSLRGLLAGRPFLLGLRLLSTALFLLVVLSGFFGEQEPERNFAPTFVWVVWWVGLGLFTAFVGNVWPLINPWKILFGWADRLVRRLGRGRDLQARLPYPSALGAWPAVTLYTGFVWVEVVYPESSAPSSIALFVLLYSGITWTGMIVFGRDVWLRNGEAFSVFFDILARFAPTEVRVTDPEVCKGCGTCSTGAEECVNDYECFARAPQTKRELNLRPPAVGLGFAGRESPDLTVFVLVVLASVTYDSLLETPLGVGLIGLSPLRQTLGLLAMPLLFLAAYLGFMKLGQLAGGGGVPFGQFVTGYVYSLVPIAIVYQTAHYYTLLLAQGQAIIALVSDPFGWGWNIFGTAGYRVHSGIVDVAFVWYSQVAMIITGHVAAVYLAHVVALRLLQDPMRAARSQYPMAALMILYTVFGLWILSQPVVG